MTHFSHLDTQKLLARINQSQAAPVNGQPCFVNCHVDRVHWLEDRADDSDQIRPLMRSFVTLLLENLAGRNDDLQVTLHHFQPGQGRAALELFERTFQSVRTRTGTEHDRRIWLIESNAPWLGDPAECDLVVVPFPLDRKLPQLHRITCASQMASLLPMDELDGSPPIGPWQLQIEVVRYQPENRCTCRYTASVDTVGRAEAKRCRSIYGKTFRDPAGEMYDRWQRVWQASQRQSIGFEVPRPLRFDADINTLWLAEAPGQPCGDTHATSTTLSELSATLEQVAACLAQFHRAQIGGLPLIENARFVKQATRYARKLAQRNPSQHDEIQAQLAAVVAQVPQQPPMQTVPVHGGLRLSQLLRCGEQLYALDFDDCAMGRREIDLASIISDVQSRVNDPHLQAAVVSQFLDNYLAASGDSHVDMAALHWLLATQSLKRQTWRQG